MPFDKEIRDLEDAIAALEYIFAYETYRCNAQEKFRLLKAVNTARLRLNELPAAINTAMEVTP